MFTTDHGIAFPRAKATLYDPGTNVTLLTRWPLGFRGHRTVHEMTSHVDILPSLLEAAGADIVDDVQGRSFLPLLQERPYRERMHIFAEKNTQCDDIKRGIRSERHKYIRSYDDGPFLRLPTDIEITATRRDMGDDHLAPRTPVELYDLEADPLEQTNLAGRPELAAVEKELADILDAFLETTSDPVLVGPIPRPAEEEAIIAAARERMAQRLEDNRRSWSAL